MHTFSVMIATKLPIRKFSLARITSLRSKQLFVEAMGQSPAAAKVKLGLCQFKVVPDKDTNLRTASTAVKEAVAAGAKLIVLPEIWNSAYETSSFPKNAEDVDEGSSVSAKLLSDLAKEYGITIVGGSIPELSKGKVYNTCLVYDRNGQLAAKHRKVHLFDIDIPGKQTFKESDTLTAGEKLTTVDTECGKLGIGICYDIRFPEMAALYAKKGVQLLIYPGAFNTTTGPAHWELLQKARAVDNQMFVATCSPAHNPEASYSVYGHSMVVSPWGQILAKAEADAATVIADIDYSEVEQRRTNMPLAQQRRYDLYRLDEVSDAKAKNSTVLLLRD